jgi:predicted MFS family arabinose efflux permease
MRPRGDAGVARTALREIRKRILEAAGGPARLQIIAVLAAILGLNMADRGTVSAVSDHLKSSFKIGNTEVGLLIAVVSFIGALATLPMGILADRVRRRTVLLVTVPLWAVAMIVSGTAGSYAFLLLSRLGLGIATAAAWPCVASLSGDFFPARERAGTYGLILAGELLGTGIGFFVSGEVSTLIDWHWSFYVMALPALALAWVIWRYLPEPERGSQQWLSAGERDPAAASRPGQKPGRDERAEGGSSMHELVRQSDVEPRKGLVLRDDPTRRGWWWAITYFMKLPTYRLLIVVSALTYYFFAGVSTLGMIYFTQHYQASRGVVSALVFVLGAGALAGVIGGGRLSERLLARGKLNARIIVPACALFLSVPFFAAGFWTTNLWLALLPLTVAAATMAAAVAPIDAARLDIVHPRMWGRGEAGRTAIRSLFEGSAPLVFGLISSWLGGGDEGLMWTFLMMLVPMLAAGSLAWPARRSYPRDVATAAASVGPAPKDENEDTF